MTVSYDAHKFLHIGLVSDIVSYDAHTFFHIVLVSDNTKSVKKKKIALRKISTIILFLHFLFSLLENFCSMNG